MAETIGSDDDESEFGSITSSQKSFLKNCPFACPDSPSTKSSDDLDNTTEILENPISPTVTRTPILSLSTPMSLDSINDEEVFRTPPENASLSSAAESEQHRVRVTETKLKSDTTPENVRVLKTNRTSDSDEPVTEVTPLSSPPAKHSDLDSPSPGKNLNLVPCSPSSATEEIKISEEIVIPFKEVIEALLRNSGENLDERDDKVSYVDVIKQLGLKFP